MPNFPFVVGDSLQIGSATISATGNAIVLPTGTSVGGTQVATTQEVATGGGPKITNLQITDVSWAVLDDTAVDTTGGYVLITGTNFVSGALVYFNQTPATSVAFVSTTSLRVTVPAFAAGTYIVYVINPDGGTAIRVPGLTASANPAWQTASGLPEQYDGVAITLNLVATDATTYTLTSGSLPPGLSLNTSTGVITGTVTGITVDTTYTFTVRATDAQLQDSPRTFTVTITVSDAYFKLTTLLLSGSAISANTVIRDSSTNNFNLTVYGDARASNFTPYGTGWSTYFSSTSGITVSALTPIGSGDLTIETFVYMTTLSGEQHMVQQGTSTTNLLLSYDGTAQKLRFVVRNDAGSSNLDINSPSAPVLNQWFHFAGTVQGTTGRMWINGNVVTTGTVSGTRSGSQTFVYMGDNGSGGSRPLTGYLSNTRIVVGTAVYTANFSPTTTNLSSVSGTSLLANQSNRFINLVGNVAATISQGSPRITSFNPFNITNTGVNGSIYLDGTGDYLSTPANTAFAMGTGDFTVEFWFYPVAYSGSQNIISHQYNSGFAIGTQTTGGTLEFYIANSFISTTTRPTLGMWNHVVCQRASGTASIYINGTRTQTGSLTGSTASTTALVVGAAVHNLPNEASNGYLSDIRIVKGSAVYSGVTITPPAAPLSAIANTSLLICQYDQPHNNHTFLDSSSNQFLITRSGNATQGTFSPFSQAGWSVYINNGTSSQIRISDNAALRIGTSAFNIEAWVYPTGFGEPFYVLRKRVNGNVGAGTWAFTVGTNGAVGLEQVQGPATIAQTSAGLVALNTWTHVAVSRDSSNNVRIFVNGIIQATATSSYNFNDASNPISLLCDYDGRNASSIGYASNLRFVIGSAVYTANFTPATSNLTSSSQGAVAADVKILTFQDNRFRDASTNNFTITISGSPSVQAFSPFAPTAVYSPAIHGGSAYSANGQTHYLVVPASPAFLYTGDLSLEMFYYHDGSDSTGAIWGTAGSGGAEQIYLNGTTGLFWNSVLYNYTGNGTLRPYQWNHICFTRQSGVIRAFINGVLLGTQSTTSSIGSSTTSPVIFNRGDLSDWVAATAYIAGLRVCNGSVPTLYQTSSTTAGTAIFTPPTEAPSTTSQGATANTVVLLLNFTNDAIADATGRNVIETVGDARTTSAVTKWTGSHSMYFDGTGDYLKIQDTDLLEFGSGNWTVDGWFYLTVATDGVLYGRDTNSGADFFIRVTYISSTPRLGVYLTANGSSFSVANTDAITGAAISLNTWTHFAVTSNNGTIQKFINGTGLQIATGITSIYNSSNTWYVGVRGNLGEGFNGYIQDLRITRGHARYTANFTAPTAPVRLK